MAGLWFMAGCSHITPSHLHIIKKTHGKNPQIASGLALDGRVHPRIRGLSWKYHGSSKPRNHGNLMEIQWTCHICHMSYDTLVLLHGFCWVRIVTAMKHEILVGREHHS